MKGENHWQSHNGICERDDKVHPMQPGAKFFMPNSKGLVQVQIKASKYVQHPNLIGAVDNSNRSIKQSDKLECFLFQAYITVS